ncbi:MAG: type II toxin-antitoxin system RelE/ParE family toxin [Chromatiales bacterium]|nr:type II toxin-antitoxin system RelE/ParE family toxin [Chromatiales bacterium]
MTWPVRFHRAALAEFTQATAWYEAQRDGLGHEFVTEIESAIRQLAKNPERYPMVHHETRRILVRRFPFSMFYRIRKDAVVVLAVFHTRRNPMVWQRRRP